MISAERLRELASEGATATQAANQLGVTRARIYQIAAREGISFEPSRKLWENRPQQPCPPAPRMRTGGVPCKVSHSVAGTVSELLVAADLLARGWEAYFPIARHRGHDIIAVKEERIITVEVRSAHRNKEGHLIFNRNARDRPSQFFALVVTGEAVIYQPDVN